MQKANRPQTTPLQIQNGQFHTYSIKMPMEKSIEMKMVILKFSFSDDDLLKEDHGSGGVSAFNKTKVSGF